jgi:hypothetical protein
MKKLVPILILCLLFLIACANNIPDSTSLSSSYDGKWEGIAQTSEGPYPIKIEIKNGIIDGFTENSRNENSRFNGYITSDNNIIINPFYIWRKSYYRSHAIHTEIICKTDFMSPDRIEGTYYLAKVDKASKYKWFIAKPATG